MLKIRSLFVLFFITSFLSTIYASDFPPAVTFSRITSVVWSGSVQLSVLAVDDVGVSKVELYINNLKVAELTRSPYDFIVDTTRYPDGVYQVTAVAYDTVGRFSSASMMVYFKNRGQVVAYSPEPKVLWKYEAEIDKRNFLFSNAPAVGDDGTLYVAAYDSVFYRYYVFAISPNGTLKWRYEVGPEFAGPVIGPDGTIYVFSGKLLALGPNGYKKWELKIGSDIAYTTNTYPHTPSISHDGTIYVAAREGLYSVSASGTINWALKQKSNVRPVVDADGTVYIAEGRNVIAVGKDGKELWRRALNGSVTWLIRGDGVVLAYQSSWKDQIVAISKAGEIVGSATIESSLSSTDVGFYQGKDGTLYLVDDKERLRAYTPDGTSKWVFDIPEKFVKSGMWIVIWVNQRALLIGESGVVYVGADGWLYGIENGKVKFKVETKVPINIPLVMSENGVIYAISSSGVVFAIQTNDQVAKAPWPMFGRNRKNTNSE